MLGCEIIAKIGINGRIRDVSRNLFSPQLYLFILLGILSQKKKALQSDYYLARPRISDQNNAISGLHTPKSGQSV